MNRWRRAAPLARDRGASQSVGLPLHGSARVESWRQLQPTDLNLNRPTAGALLGAPVPLPAGDDVTSRPSQGTRRLLAPGAEIPSYDAEAFEAGDAAGDQSGSRGRQWRVVQRARRRACHFKFEQVELPGHCGLHGYTLYGGRARGRTGELAYTTVAHGKPRRASLTTARVCMAHKTQPRCEGHLSCESGEGQWPCHPPLLCTAHFCLSPQEGQDSHGSTCAQDMHDAR